MADEKNIAQASPAKRQFKRNKTPAVLQLEAVECGAAALAIILSHYGRFVPLANLRRECGVSRDGSKASNVVRAARTYGMEAKGFSKTVEQLLEIDAPCIIFWNFNHFVVFESYKNNEVHLNDPAVGHRTIDLESFKRQYTGIVLTMEPGDEFVKEGSKPSVTAAIRKRLHGSGLALLFCFLIGLLLVIPGLAVPAFNQIFIDRIVLDGNSEWLRPLLLAMVFALVIQALLRFLQLRYLRRLKIRLSIMLSSNYIWHLLRLPASFYGQRSAGEVANRSTLNDKLAGVMSGQLAQTAIDVIMMVFYASLMFFYDVLLTSIGILFAAANILVLRWAAAGRVEGNMRVLQEYGKAQGVAIAGLQAMETIKSAGVESGFFAKWAGYYAKGTNARQNLELSNQWLSVVPALLNSLTTAAILVVGALRVISGDITIGMLVAFQSLMGSFMRPVNTLMGLGSTFQELAGDLERVDDVLQNETVDGVGNNASKLPGGLSRLGGGIEVNNISFGYSPLEKPLLTDFNLNVVAGASVALVGGSGSGKSTVARLLCGEYEPWEGEIKFGGFDLSGIPSRILSDSRAAVDQEIALFRGTVRENLTLWDLKVPEMALRQACEDAAILETILEMPRGFETEMVEGGANLSGGQRQRFEIARALVRNPSIVIFDEATSALDAQTEEIVMSRLRQRGCTSVLIAHRLSTIRDCDEIIVMQAGSIVERGTHQQLWETQGRYYGLMSAEDS